MNNTSIDGRMADAEKMDTGFTDERIAELAEAMRGYKGEAKARSFRQFVFDLYPAITQALENGATRKEIYNRFLTDEERSKYALTTFIGYYQQAKKQAEQEAAKAAREAKKAEKPATPAQSAPVSENREKPAPTQSTPSAAQKAMEAAKANGNKITNSMATQPATDL